MEKKKITRRDFVKGAVASVVSATAVGALARYGTYEAAAESSSSQPVEVNIVDSHVHLLPPPMNSKFVEWVNTTKNFEDGPVNLWLDEAFESVDKHITEMDKYGISKSITIYSSNVLNIVTANTTEGQSASDVISAMNDSMLHISRQTNDRIVPAMWIDPNLGNDALAEMERTAAAGAKAFSILTGYMEEDKLRIVDNPKYDDFWNKANSLGLPVFLHFSSKFSLVDAEVPLKGFMADTLLLAGMSQIAENTLAMTRMILSGTLDKYPDLKLVFGQLGGMFPFMLGRFDMLYNMYAGFAKAAGNDVMDKNNAENFLRKLSDYTGSLYVDTHSLGREAIQCAIEIMGEDHVLFGSDYPITAAAVGREYGLSAIDSFPESDSAKIAMYGGAASKLLKL